MNSIPATRLSMSRGSCIQLSRPPIRHPIRQPIRQPKIQLAILRICVIPMKKQIILFFNNFHFSRARSVFFYYFVNTRVGCLIGCLIGCLLGCLLSQVGLANPLSSHPHPPIWRAATQRRKPNGEGRALSMPASPGVRNLEHQSSKVNMIFKKM